MFSLDWRLWLEVKCTVRDVELIIQGCPVIRENWTEFARGLRICSGRIKEFRQDLLLNKITYSDLIFDLLELWVGGNGGNATLSTLLHVLEEECGAAEVGESLRNYFKLPSFSPPEELSSFHHRLPERPSYYVDRTLITRNIISHVIFEHDSPDIFLIKGMSRSELSKLVKEKMTGDSKEQIRCTDIQPRFIVLKQDNHYSKICSKTSNPVHLLRKDGDGRLRWIKSNGNIATLQGWIDHSQEELDEETFCKTVASQYSPVCISDSPGMGKTLLLAELESRLVKLYPDRLTSFITLTEFIKLFKQVGMEDTLPSIIQVLKNLFGGNLSLSESNEEEDEYVTYELLLDGFDELDSHDHQLAYDLLKTIRSSFRSIRLWVTSRPHLLGELERNLNQLGYNIRPFQLDDQVHFLSAYWSRKKQLDKVKCQQFANHCLDALKLKMNSTDQDIAGIPLQCLLIGECYEDDALNYAQLAAGNESWDELEVLEIEMGTIANFYPSIIAKKFHKYQSMDGEPKLNEVEMMTIHALLSWELIFPDRLEDVELTSAAPIGTDEMEQVLKVGILESASTAQSAIFLHRTFAEYFVAWFVLHDLEEKGELGIGLPKCLLSVLGTQSQVEMQLDSFKFTHPVITYFVNSLVPYLPNLPTHPSFKFPSVDYFLRIAHSSVNANYDQLFNFLMRLDSFDNHASKVFDEEFVCLAIWNSSLEIVMMVLNSFEKYHELYPSTQVQLLRTAVKRGKCSILEFLLKEKKLLHIVEDRSSDLHLIHECIENSKNDSELELEQKITVLGMLVDINPNLLEIKGGMWQEKPPLSYGVHVRLLKEMIRLGADVQAQGIGGNTILHMNYSRNHLSSQDYHDLVHITGGKVLTSLISLKGEGQDTPLMTVLRWVDPLPQTLMSFKDAGVSFNSVDIDGDTILEIAIKNGRSSKTTHALIEFGAKVNWKPLGWLSRRIGLARPWKGKKTLLHHAAENGNLEAVELLLEDKRISVNLKDEEGLTPLDCAIRSYSDDGKHLQVALTLGRRGGSLTKHVNPEGQPFLHMAVEKGDHQLVEVLILHGIDVNCKDGNGNTALHLAAAYKQDRSKANNFLIAQTLLQRGAKPKGLNNHKMTPLDIALRSESREFKTFLSSMPPATINLVMNLAVLKTEPGDNENFLLAMQELVNAMGSVNHQDSSGNSILHIASRKGLGNVVHFLCSSGANLNLKNRDGETPLHYAARCSDRDVSIEIITFLIQKGADPNSRDNNCHNFVHFYAAFYDTPCPSLWLTGGGEPDVQQFISHFFRCRADHGIILIDKANPNPGEKT